MVGERTNHLPGDKKIKNIRQLLSNKGLPVLFVSDPVNGDLFQFGTHEELENEFEARQKEGEDCELTTTDDLNSRLDLEIYEDEPPRIWINL